MAIYAEQHNLLCVSLPEKMIQHIVVVGQWNIAAGKVTPYCRLFRAAPTGPELRTTLFQEIGGCSFRTPNLAPNTF